ncbi:unnamed protein product [Didymodactylos carnosus]|uniref:Pentapeptide repeat-containing protein n=1 Tax=Didymodactylos carnosus TaxID=1234261 RepID=A0A8S2EUL1_9BILA|nr:unnamed protein product [Didymodactylos carnosus]CAF4082054.1 unnamed protein product [Didymodactylos carnosus]
MARQQAVRIDRSTNTKSFKITCPNHHTETSAMSSFCSMQLKDIFKILGVLLVPLTLGVATTLLSIQQTQLNQENRQKDTDIAQKQRQQDAHLANQAENERILATYLNDISTLLLDKNTTLDKDSVASSVVRAKTLTTLLQLDVERKRQIILFLYETKLIMRNSEQPPVNLFDADLDNLDMSLPRSKRKLYKTYEVLQIQLRGASLVNSSFAWRRLDFSDFSQTDLTIADFTSTDLSYVDFSYALLSKTDFTNATVSKAIFAYANLSGSNLSDEQLSTTLTFQGAFFLNGTTASLKDLVRNGDAEQTCSNTSTVSPLGWIVTNGSISAILRPQNRSDPNNKCYFSSLSPHDISVMYQVVDLRDYSKWIMNKRAFYGFKITLSGTNYGQYHMIVNLRYISSTGRILEKVTICPRSIHDEHCDWTSLVYQEPLFTLYRDLYSNGKTDTKSMDIEIIFKRRSDNGVILSADNVITSCDNIVFNVYLTP